MTFYVNPFTWSQVLVGAEHQGEWQGIATLVYKKAPYDWDLLKEGAEKSVVPERRPNILRATHEWFVDQMNVTKNGLPAAELNKLFKAAHEDARGYVLEGVSALLLGYGKRIDAITVIAIEKGSPAYRDIEDLREVFAHAKKFYTADSLDQAVDDALGYFGIYEC